MTHRGEDVTDAVLTQPRPAPTQPPTVSQRMDPQQRRPQRRRAPAA
ncbi:MAG: hypothetical protein R2856_12340 [Caldilineaceae bacterium]